MRGMRTTVCVLLALVATYFTVVVVALLFAFAINVWGLLIVALVVGTILVRVALRPRRSVSPPEN